MKKCPQCSSEYFDNMLDYCLEDGAQLIVVTKNLHTKTAERTNYSTTDRMQAKTEHLPLEKVSAAIPETITIDAPRAETNVQNQPKTKKIKETLTDKWYQVLEYGPLFTALAHNYWQWVYLARNTAGQLSEFLLSYQFLIWFLLLISGTIFGFISLKYGRNKSLAAIALVILAINVLLSLVPK